MLRRASVNIGVVQSVPTDVSLTTKSSQRCFGPSFDLLEPGLSRDLGSTQSLRDAATNASAESAAEAIGATVLAAFCDTAQR